MTKQQTLTALQIRSYDNVATCIRPQRAGEAAVCGGDGPILTVTLLDEIPFGHKFAVCPIAAGEQIIKYGCPIGRAVRDIRAGEHVHVHNVGSLRCGAEGG